MMNDINDQYLVKLYDDLQSFQQRLINDMKSLNENDMTKETDIQKQIQLVYTLMTTTLKLRNLKKKIILKQQG